MVFKSPNQFKMSNFTREDLAFTGYSQTTNAADYLKTNDIPERTYMDKTEEFKIIHFSKQFLKTCNVPQTKASFQKAENFLQHPVLENEIYQAQLSEWTASNWIKI